MRAEDRDLAAAVGGHGGRLRGGRSGQLSSLRAMAMRRLRDLPSTVVLGREVPVASSFRSRLLGLAHLDGDEAGAGLLIPRCSGVHTFGMRFPLDIVFLDRDGRPCSSRREVPPRRFAWDRRAHAVLELACSYGVTAREVQVPSLSLERLRGVLEPQAWDRFEAGFGRAQKLLRGARSGTSTRPLPVGASPRCSGLGSAWRAGSASTCAG